MQTKRNQKNFFEKREKISSTIPSFHIAPNSQSQQNILVKIITYLKSARQNALKKST
jgi:hypothetical protein